MRFSDTLVALTGLACTVSAMPQQAVLQQVDAPASSDSVGANALLGADQWRGGVPSPFPPGPSPGNETGVGHLSEWSRQSKLEFLQAVRENRATDYSIVLGNEAGGECITVYNSAMRCLSSNARVFAELERRERAR